MTRHIYSPHRSAKGFTVIELVIVIAIIFIMTAISVQQAVGSRRLLRSAAITREVVSALRDARQIAISQRRAITFQYDDTKKQINIINHGADVDGVGISGTDLLVDSKYPNTTGSSVERTYQLASSSGIPASEIAYGLPSGAATSAGTLGDKTALTALTNQKLNVTFQPDGSVVSSTGATLDVALFIYNAAKPKETAMAISVLGGTGRIKAWRYSSGADKYVE
ncbi:MAG TPA: prepilin-type N-terminal cleavage/methylation domain-containing protein [Pyrinomonadaceae bacterium]|jgi:Tfp pilus assembly protein FimT|nr:prepilin-type N-terminal cleavage/methylation domain-containing protein [Pyrinomonadaceae bacterium]